MSAEPPRISPGDIPPNVDPRAINADSVTAIPPPRSAIPSTRNVLYAGLVTGITATVLVLLLRLLGWALRIDLTIVRPGADDPTPVPLLALVLWPLAWGVLGSLAAAALLGVSRNQGWVNALGTLLAVATIALILSGPESGWTTQTLLVIMTLVTWVVVVPQVARVVGDSDPRITLVFREPSAPAPAQPE